MAAEADIAEERGRPVNALEVEDLSHAFGARTALDRAEIVLPPSRLGILLGLNGAGKTTLFSLMTRLYDSRRGTIRIFGHDLRRAPSRALQQLGVVFQQRTLDLDLTVLQNLLYHGALHGLGRREARERAEAELRRVGLQDRMGERCRRLSGGQVRRVEIARALLHRPRLLLLDEPTVGLDIEARQSILDHVDGLRREQGVAVLWATHLIDEVLPEAQVIVLHRGRVLAQGTRGEVVAQAGAADVREAFTRLTREDAGDPAGGTAKGAPA